MEVRTTRWGEPDRRMVRRAERLDQLEGLLRRAPRSVPEIARALGTQVRSVYILLAALGERGRTVARVGPKAGGRYILVK